MTREEKEQRIRDLKQELFYSEDIGDWKMARALETLLNKISDAKTLIGIIAAFKEINDDLVDVIKRRVAVRKEIEDLTKELDNE